MKWNNQQEKALRDVDRWFYTESKHKPIYRVFGYAGTGKSTLARHFASNIDGHVCYAAFTGKAASVMRRAGCVGAKTIHSLIYKTEEDEKGRVTFRLNRNNSDLKGAALLIVDECSMVDEKIGRDLLSFGVPILVLGDPAQLPPPGGAGFFTECEPDNMLTEIHRQAEDNPIIHLSKLVREGNRLSKGDYGESRIVSKIGRQTAIDADQILVGRNATRMDKNYKMRRMLGYGDGLYPVVNDKLICLKNDSSLGIYNGMMFKVDGINQQLSGPKSKFFHMSLDGEDYTHAIMVKVPKAMFSGERIPPGSWILKEGQQFDYGYAITTHKAQGSQWENVLIYDESWCFRDEWQRWLYTAITRASERVTMVVD
jgi:exodeoxyribonuclease-5